MKARNKPGRGGVRQGAGRPAGGRHNLSIKIDDSLYERIEEARGDTARNSFIRNTIDDALRRSVGDVEWAAIFRLRRKEGLDTARLTGRAILLIYDTDAELRRFDMRRRWESNAVHTHLMMRVCEEISREVPEAAVELRVISNRDYGRWLKKNILADSVSARNAYLKERSS